MTPRTRERRRAAGARTAPWRARWSPRPGFARTSNGFVGTSDGWTDLASDKTLDFDYDTAPDGNVLQTGEIALDGDATTFTLALGFGGSTAAAERDARARASPTASRAAPRRLRRRVARLPGRLAACARGADRRAAHAIQRRA